MWGLLRPYVAHAHLAGGEDAEVILGKVAEGVHVELHGLLLVAADGSGRRAGGRAGWQR